MKAVQQAFGFAPPPAGGGRRNIVIEAGAGTGKTTAIVGEVLRLIVDREDLAPERIVLMTFTEKAAGEIAERIRGALEELGQALSDPTAASAVWPAGSPDPLVVIGNDERSRRAIAHHLAGIDSLRSQTIHSFCQSLLRSYPIEAGLDPQFKIIEGFERSLLYDQLYDAWVDEETRLYPTAESVREWETLFEHAGYLFAIRDMVFSLLERRDLLGERGYEFGDFGEIAGPLAEAVASIRKVQRVAGDDHALRVFEYLRANLLPEAGDADAWIDYLQPIAASIREANLPRDTVLKEALRYLRAGDKGRSIRDRLVSHRAAMALVALTRRFVAYLDREKRHLGVADFDDLLLRTAALLDDPVVLARARSQFDYVFVDEFQDTDRTQARIIRKLVTDATGAWVPGKTVVVGDPKQSIYGFRRADPETYYRLTEEMRRASAEHRIIDRQYRSDPALIDVVNAMFTRIFPDDEHDPNVFRPSYNPVRAARSEPRRALDARITLLHTAHDDRADRYFAEAESIAAWITKNRDGGPLDLQRFAILFRRLTKLDDYLDTLERHGIEYVLPPTRLFLDRPAPVDLAAVLRAIAYPFDRGAQISAARTPYFGLTDVEIVEGVTMSEATPGTWSDFAAAIEGFRNAARHRTVSELIDLLIEQRSIERVYDAMPDGPRHLRHLEHLRATALDYDLRAGGSVRQFVDEIQRRRVEPEEIEPSLADDTQNAVRILTVHAAKGLEFETVILPDLSFSSGSGEGINCFTVEEPRSLVLAGRAESVSASFRFAGGDKLKRIAAKREDAEQQRLFYVAVTRAKTDVVFVCNTSDHARNTGFFRNLCDALALGRDDLERMWPAEGRALRETAVGTVAFERFDAPSSRPGQAAMRRRLMDDSLQADLETGGLAGAVIAAPDTVAERLTPGEIAARRAASRNIAAGILLHRFLELWDGRSEPARLIDRLAAEAAADPETVDRVRRRAAAVSRSPVLQRILRAETVAREMPIRFLEDGAPVEQRIDRLIREGGREIVVDYKSGAPDPARVARDRQQVARYRDAVRAITGRECGGLVWYIDLDHDEVVEDS